MSNRQLEPNSNASNHQGVIQGITSNISIFISLIIAIFVARTDVVAKRFYRKDGTKFYLPLCINSNTNNCPRKNNPSYKCSSCPNKFHLPLSNNLIEKHIQGEIQLATYPIEPKSNSCKYVAIDFDNHDGSTKPFKDLLILSAYCSSIGLPFYALKSSSGKGFHTYFFFKKAIKAKKAREFAHLIIEQASTIYPGGNFNSFDSLFPKQDTLKDDHSLGNPIALPFFGDSMKYGDTLLLDPYSDFITTFKDQFSILNGILRIDINQINNYIKTHRKLINSKAIKGNNQSSQNLAKSLLFSEIKLSEQFIGRYGKSILFCYTTATWYIWRSGRWIEDKNGLIHELVKAFIKISIKQSVSSTRKNSSKVAMSISTYAKIRNILKLAMTNHKVSVSSSRFDLDPMTINVINGVINLRNGELSRNRKCDLITKQACITFDPSKSCPNWLYFLQQTMSNDNDLINYLQRAVGYSLTGSLEEQALFYAYGTGANGKSTFLNIIRLLLGEYSENTPFDTFLAGRMTGAVRDDLARLRGIRFLTTVEVEPGKTLSESTIKTATGGDPITCRFLYGKYFTYTPQFKIWMAANTMVNVRGTDHGIWRRIHLIPFNNTIAPEEQDKHLYEKLTNEMSGIFNWALEGCIEWQRQGLNPPDVVVNATDKYRASQDPLADFLREMCTLSDNYSVTKKLAYETYSQWCENNHEKPLKKRAFGELLRARNIGEDKTGIGHIWTRIGLKPESSVKDSTKDELSSSLVDNDSIFDAPSKSSLEEDKRQNFIGSLPPIFN